MIKITEYISRKTNYTTETVLLISDLIDTLIKLGLPYGTREAILRYTLNACTFTDKDIKCFAHGVAPEEYEMVPVEATVTRLYRIYVKVPKGSDSSMIKDVAKKQILDNGLAESDLAPDWDIERDDIVDLGIDWAGVQEADE